MKFYNTFFFNLILVFSASAQVIGFNEGVTRAVVIGISDYQDEDIPDLRFAHRDAEAFVSWLRSPSSGQINSENIQILINDQATTGQIVSVMSWLVQESQSGDRAIIYFSGHGDVERISKFQRGYLLTHDSPPNNYMAGAFPVLGLQDIITTLSDENVQVIMISDACRIGKLAGSGINGSQATTAALKIQFANEIKILSCQPEEFSLEGEQWGGGRGCFSYHLLEGLYGFADQNTDLTINLLELGRYLEDKVVKETAPHIQIPITSGSKTTHLAVVDEITFAELKMKKNGQLPTLASIKSKGINGVFFEQVDSTIQELYDEFLAAIDRGDLMEPIGKSANDYYETLSQEPSLKKLHGFMKRNFAAALQEESQQAINAYLKVTNQELEDMSKGSLKYSKFSKYLEKSAELLGPDHYIYNFLKAKQYFFEALDIRIRISDCADSPADSAAIWTNWRQNKLQKALEYEENAAFIYNELGLGLGIKGVKYFEQAITHAPKWAIPYVNISEQYKKTTKLKEAEEYALKALELAPKSGVVYYMLGFNYAGQKRYVEAEEMYKKAMQFSPENIDIAHSIGIFYKRTKRFKEAEKIFLETIALSPMRTTVYEDLSSLYIDQTLEYDKAIAINRKKLGMRPTDGDAFCNLVDAYANKGRIDKVKDLIIEMRQIDSKVEHWEGTVCLGYAHKRLNEYDLAVKFNQKAIQQAPKGFWTYFKFAEIHQDLQDYESFFKDLDTSISKGMYYNEVGKHFYFRSSSFDPGYKSFASKINDKLSVQGLGSCLMGLYYDSQNNFSEAEVQYQLAVKRSPERKKNWFHYAESCYLSGQLEKSDSLFQRFIEVSAGNVLNYIQVAHFYRLHSENQLAEEYLQKALAIDSSRQEIYWNLAWVLYSSNKQFEAQDFLSKGIALQSSLDTKSKLFYLKGLLYYYSGMYKESLEALQEASEKEPNLKTLIVAIKRELHQEFALASVEFEKASISNFSDDNLMYLNARQMVLQGDYDSAIQLLEKATNKGSLLICGNELYFGGRTYDFILKDPVLKPLQKEAGFRDLLKRYFPEKMDNSFNKE